MSKNSTNKKEPNLGLYKLVFKNGLSTEVPAISPEHSVRVVALALGLPEEWVWNGLKEIHIIKEPGELEH
jgi:hypothetical protein